jgi:hypothetical protein
VYSARTAAGGPRVFGTSGLLYRSNKLMYDRQSLTLWSNLTGEPVIGRLAASPLRLEMLPVAVTSWGEWRARHPDTTVLRLAASHGDRWSFDYRPGAADRARAGVSFPVWRRSRALAPRTEVFGLRLGAGAKAFPVAALLRARVVNDSVGGEPVVLLGEAKGGAVRAYRRGERRFRASERPDRLLDDAGRSWRVTEDALAPLDPQAPTPSLARLPGHLSFWFGWYGFFPETEVYAEEGRR